MVGKAKKDQIPRGWLAVKVGQTAQEQERFVVPLVYLNHPLFMQLLKEAEKEYGFHHKGLITIPCQIQQFRNVQGIIDRELHHHHIHNLVVGCFRVGKI